MLSPYMLEVLMTLSAQSRNDNSEELLPGSLRISCGRGTYSHDGQLRRGKKTEELLFYFPYLH